MILAAGYGTRLRPVTFALPKPMVPLCNRPLIAWIIGHFLAAGVREFVVNLHHLPEAIESDLPPRFPEARFEFSYEPEILGTGGAVRKVRPLLENEPQFFLANGDTLQFAPLDALLAARREHDAVAALALRHPPANDRFTPVYVDGGRITGFGKGTGEPLMFSGTHCLSSRVFDYLPDKGFSGIVDEVYQPLIDSGRESIAGVVHDGVWFDIGTPLRYLEATRGLLAGRSLIDESARVTGRVERSAVGARSTIEGTVADSAVWDDCFVAAGVALEGCIVAHGAEIRRSYRGALICRDDAAIPDGPWQREDGVVIVRYD
jgi:NDP-sugar pyrophosphorylase family protein